MLTRQQQPQPQPQPKQQLQQQPQPQPKLRPQSVNRKVNAEIEVHREQEQSSLNLDASEFHLNATTIVPVAVSECLQAVQLPTVETVVKSVVSESEYQSSDGVAASPALCSTLSICTLNEVITAPSFTSGGNMRTTLSGQGTASSTTRSGVFVTGNLEVTKVQFLIDTGADASNISLDTLTGMKKTLRTTFQDSTATLQVAHGKSLQAKGFMLSNVTLGGRTVIDTVYAAPITDTTFLGLFTMQEIDLEITVACVRLITGQSTTLRRVRTS